MGVDTPTSLHKDTFACIYTLFCISILTYTLKIMSSHWYPFIPIQPHRFHSCFLSSLTMRKLTLNSLNLLNYSIHLHICYLTAAILLPTRALTSLCAGLSPPCWHLLTLLGLQHSMLGSPHAWCLLYSACSLTADTRLSLLRGHPPYPALTLTLTSGCHPVWSVSCYIWALAPCCGELGFFPSGADAYLTLPYFMALGLSCHAREGAVARKRRKSKFYFKF